jgi:hypothetical protein
VPIAFAPLAGFAFGAALAWVAAPALARDDGPVTFSTPFALVSAFAALLWLPIVGYFVAFHADWSYLYLVSAQRVPSAVDLGLVLLSAAAVPGGFFVAARPVRKGRMGPAAVLVAAPLAVVVAGIAAASSRLAVSGTYAQFHGEFGTEPIGASTLGKGVLLMASLLALGLAWTARSLARMAAEE